MTSQGKMKSLSILVLNLVLENSNWQMEDQNCTWFASVLLFHHRADKVLFSVALNHGVRLTSCGLFPSPSDC